MLCVCVCACVCVCVCVCVQIAEDGLKFLHDNFEFVRDGKSMPLSTAMKEIKSTYVILALVD